MNPVIERLYRAIDKANPNHDSKGRFASYSGRGVAAAVLPGDLGVVHALGGTTGQHATKGKVNTNPKTAEARANLRKVGKRLSPDEMTALRRKVLDAYIANPEPTAEELKRYAKYGKLSGQLRVTGTKHRRGGDAPQNSTDRHRNKEYLLRTFGDGHTVGCTFCGIRLNIDTISREKMTPARGYKNSNLAPSCTTCNMSHSNKHFLAKLGVSGKKGVKRTTVTKAEGVCIGRVIPSDDYDNAPITVMGKVEVCEAMDLFGFGPLGWSTVAINGWPVYPASVQPVPVSEAVDRLYAVLANEEAS